MIFNENEHVLEALKVARDTGYNHGIMDAYDVCEKVIQKWCGQEIASLMLLSIIEELTSLVDDDDEEVEES